MRLTLEITSGPYAGKKITLEPGRTVSFGRTEKADFPTQDTYMSGVHFAVECGPESCQIRDLDSRNGTLLNGEPVKAAVLRDGDQIFAGQTDFVARVEKTAPARPPAAKTAATHVPPTQEIPVPEIPVPKTPAQPVPDDVPAYLRSPTGAPSTPLQTPTGAPSTTDELQPSQPRPRPHQPPPAEVSPQSWPAIPQGTTPFGAQSYHERGTLSPIEVSSARIALETSSASTPKGRLVQILREQRDPLYALFDAQRDPRALDFLKGSGEEYASLYEGERDAAIAPYIARLTPETRLLETLVLEGWGKGWGVYLTSAASLAALRDYFRQTLLVKVGDREFLFRFYDPEFLRGTLRTSTPEETAKFFGPISRYFIEAVKPEIVEQFTRTERGAQLKERLLLLQGS
ncbi:MAG: DUF4123 domain-containing protein [Pyrinomonadaceae bacterium]